MLSKILTKEQCATCRFCCSFRRKSAWETPLFPNSVIEKLHELYDSSVSYPIVMKAVTDNASTTDLSAGYTDDDEENESPCQFLDKTRGCILSDEYKPLDCKIWPLRIMNKDGRLVIALTPTCPSVNQVPFDKVTELVTKDGLGAYIYEEAMKMPDIIKDYREGFPIVMELQKQ